VEGFALAAGQAASVSLLAVVYGMVVSHNIGMKKTDLTQERVLSQLEYNRESGTFAWKQRPAGHTRKSGYVSIHIDGVEVKAHQLVWFLETGNWPNVLIDHINGNPSDNRIENLRDASASKLLGATWNKRLSKWQVQIKLANGARKYIGLFECPNEAHAAYLAAKRIHHEGCTI
jgi:hypothetical protein